MLKLLAAAGQDAPAMVQAANKYGQNAVHVAARKVGRSCCITAARPRLGARSPERYQRILPHARCHPAGGPQPLALFG